MGRRIERSAIRWRCRSALGRGFVVGCARDALRTRHHRNGRCRNGRYGFGLLVDPEPRVREWERGSGLSLRFCRQRERCSEWRLRLRNERERCSEWRLRLRNERERCSDWSLFRRRDQPLRRRVSPRFELRFLGCERERRAERRTRTRRADRDRGADGRLLRCWYDPLSGAQIGARSASVYRSRGGEPWRCRSHQRLCLAELRRSRGCRVRGSFSATHRRRDLFGSGARCNTWRMPLR
jgi:hypothetical protein